MDLIEQLRQRELALRSLARTTKTVRHDIALTSAAAAELDRLRSSNEAMRKALDEAGEFVRAYAKRNPVFAKGYEKDVIKQAVAIVAKLEAISSPNKEKSND